MQLVAAKTLELLKDEEVKQRLQPEFDDAGLYQTPDGGWQVNFRRDKEGSIPAAITMRPGDKEVFEVHGGICGKWYKEADEGRSLGWPVSDEKPCGGGNKISLFEKGTIFGNREKGWEMIVRPWDDSIQWLMTEAARGQVWAQAELANCYLCGFGVPKDFGLASKWLNTAKEAATEEDLKTYIEQPYRHLQTAARQFILSL